MCQKTKAKKIVKQNVPETDAGEQPTCIQAMTLIYMYRTVNIYMYVHVCTCICRIHVIMSLGLVEITLPIVNFNPAS